MSENQKQVIKTWFKECELNKRKYLVPAQPHRKAKKDNMVRVPIEFTIV